MKTKTKKTVTKKAKKRPIPLPLKKVVLAHARLPLLRHFRLIEHKHTGKLIHFRHTSHVALAIILIFVGFFLYVNEGMVQAETHNESILIGAIVPGPAPTVGAVITSPTDGVVIKDKIIVDVEGTCAVGTFVVVKNNDSIVGSTNCTSAGIFNLQIQLQAGKNTLSSLDYDDLNQSGPKTPSIVVNLEMTVKVAPEVTTPELPANPSVVASVDNVVADCSSYKSDTLPIGGEPHVAVVCIPRSFSPKVQQTMGILVWGGTPPYAISIDFGTGSDGVVLNSEKDTLLNISEPGYKTVTFSYAVPNTYKIALKLKDSVGKEAIVQTSVQVNGEVETPVTALTNDVFNTPWFKTPVPFYLIAVAITLGFWGGDIFDRYFGAKKLRSRSRRVSRSS